MTEMLEEMFRVEIPKKDMPLFEEVRQEMGLETISEAVCVVIEDDFQRLLDERWPDVDLKASKEVVAELKKIHEDLGTVEHTANDTKSPRHTEISKIKVGIYMLTRAIERGSSA